MGVTCRSCGGAALRPVLSLGTTPLANALRTEAQLREPEPRFPLAIVFCADCTLVQLTESVPPEVLFADYPYFSSFSDTMLAHARALVSSVLAERPLGASSLAAEVASNDGYLLQYYRDAGVPVLGIDAAANIVEHANARGVRTIHAFFGAGLATDLARDYGRADVIHAHNVLAHVPDLNGVVSGLARFVKPDGMVIVEAAYVRNMIEQVEFDQIYHEHLCYFSLTALVALFARHRLPIYDAEWVPMHGGSLRIFASPVDAGRPRSDRMVRMLEDERAAGLTTEPYYVTFSQRVDRLRRELVALVRRLRGEGKRLAAYGASAKGSTLLNYFGIGAPDIEFVADRSTVKQGRYTPGTHLPIKDPEALLRERPDYVLLLTWNFADEILAQQQAYRDQGGRFIIPMPEPRIV